MSTISKACMEISKSLKNFKFNRSSTNPENQKDSSNDSSKTPNNLQTQQPTSATTSTTTTSSQQQQSGNSSTTTTNSPPHPTTQTRSNDSSWATSGEMSVTEALTRAFRQATNRVRSFSNPDRGGAQSFAVVAPTTSSPPTTTALLPSESSTATTTTTSASAASSTKTETVATSTSEFVQPAPQQFSPTTTIPSQIQTTMTTTTSYQTTTYLPLSPSGKSFAKKQTNDAASSDVEGSPLLCRESDSSFICHHNPLWHPPASRSNSNEDLWQNEKILAYFFRYFSVCQLCTLAQVCRVWRDILYSDTQYWVEACPTANCRELSQKEEPVRRAFYLSLELRRFDSLCLVGLLDDDVGDLIRLFPFCRTGVRKLSVRCSNVTDRGLKKLIDFATSATSFELTGCNEITEAGLWTCITHRFTSFTLADCINVADDSVAAVAQLLPNLKELNLQAYHVTDTALSSFSNKQGASLKTLRLLSCWEITNHGIVNVIRSLPNLTVLSLSGCSKITDDGVEVVSENLRKLKSLDLSWCSRLTDASLEYIACDLIQLEELTLDR